MNLRSNARCPGSLREFANLRFEMQTRTVPRPPSHMHLLKEFDSSSPNVKARRSLFFPAVLSMLLLAHGPFYRMIWSSAGGHEFIDLFHFGRSYGNTASFA